MSLKLDGNGIITGISQVDVSGSVNAGSLASPLAGVSTRVSTPQIAFPAVSVPSGDPHILDDYEEGTWVPVLVTGTITVNEALYIKIGGLVWISAFVTFGPTIPTVQVMFTGLPFPCIGSCALALGYVSGAAAPPATTAMVVGNQINIYNGVSFSTLTNFGSGGNLYFGGCYRTNA